MGSPGKVWHDRTLEAVGSTPIGSTILKRAGKNLPFVFGEFLVIRSLQHDERPEVRMNAMAGDSAVYRQVILGAQPSGRTVKI